MKVFAYVIPLIFLLSFGYEKAKKVKIFESFTEGAKGALPLIVSIFPYIMTVMILSKLFQVSGLEQVFQRWASPFLGALGIPKEITPLLIIKPLSGSGGIAVLSDILTRYGVDSYIGRCACVTYGSSETIFYIGAVYFAGIKRKKLTLAMVIVVFSYLLSTILCCLLCKII